MGYRAKNDRRHWLIAAVLLICASPAHADSITGCHIAPSGGDFTGAELSTKLAAGNVSLDCSDNLQIKDAITWSTDNTLTLTATNNVNINANISASGNMAGLVIKKGSYQLKGASITLSGTEPTFSLGGTNYAVINSLGTDSDATTPPATPTLQGMAATANLAGNYVLGSDIDAGATSGWNSRQGFTPIGNATTKFTAKFDGLGHAISNLSINRSTANYVGLFGYAGTGSIIHNVGLVGGSVNGGNFVGSLAGNNSGTVSNSYNTGNVVGGKRNTGGLVGLNVGTVSNSYATGSVNCVDCVSDVSVHFGGLVGTSIGTVSNSYATGSVNGGVANGVGGLVGYIISGTVSTSYAAGNVTGTGNKSRGGLVGYSGGTVSNSYWNKEASGQTAGIGGGTKTGVTGLTSAQMKEKSNFKDFDFTSTWIIIEGVSYPMLAYEYSTTIYNLEQLQLMAENLSASFTLGNDIDASATSNWNGGKGFMPIGNYSTPFTGSLDGKGYVISDLTIDRQTADNVGLFGYTGPNSMIRDVGFSGGNVTGQNSVGALAGYNGGAIHDSFAAEGSSVTGMGNGSSGSSGSGGSGGLVGTNNGTISNSHTSGSVTGIDDVGGLVGVNIGTINTGYSLAMVTNSSNQAGGLVGTNKQGASISASFASGITGDAGTAGEMGGLVGLNNGSISYSNALGKVKCGSNSSCGGLVGVNSSNISNSYATGGVDGTGKKVGGLVGFNNHAVINSYATGSVFGNSSAIGGLVGNNSGTITKGYWNKGVEATGVGTGPSTGATGLTAAQMLVSSSFNNYTLTTTSNTQGWVVVNTDGSLQTARSGTAAATSPMLATEYSTTINNAHQLQLMLMDLGASYSMGADVDASGSGNGNDVWGTLGFVPIKIGTTNTPFTGVFDGQLHKISKLRINRTDNNVGLFGYTNNAAISNVGLYDIQVSGSNNVGGLAGIFNGGTISNSYVNGYMSGAFTFQNGKGDNIGGLVGGNNGGYIYKSNTSGIAYGGNFVGGLAGYNTGMISNSYSSSNVNARMGKSLDGKYYGAAGGLIGHNISDYLIKRDKGKVINSYARGHVLVKADGFLGGLIGLNGGSCMSIVNWCNSGPILNSYWDTTTSGQTTSTDGKGLADVQMKQQSSFSGWDFTNTWEMKTYPALRNMPAGYTP